MDNAKIEIKCPFKIFWVGEESECYAAESLDQLLEDMPDLVEDVQSGDYGEIDPAEIVQLRDDETGELFEGPYAAFVAKEMAQNVPFPFLVSTAYA